MARSPGGGLTRNVVLCWWLVPVARTQLNKLAKEIGASFYRRQSAAGMAVAVPRKCRQWMRFNHFRLGLCHQFSWE